MPNMRFKSLCCLETIQIACSTTSRGCKVHPFLEDHWIYCKGIAQGAKMQPKNQSTIGCRAA